MSEPSALPKIAELFGGSTAAPKRKHKEGKDPDESRELGRQCLSDGDYEGAIQHFKSANDQDGTMASQDLLDIAGAYEYADLAPQARRQYELALRAGKENPEAHLGISDLYRRYGRFRDSLEPLLHAIYSDPSNPFYHLKLAEALREMGEPTRALAAAHAAVAAKPDEAFYHYWTGDLLIELRRYEEALDSLRAAIELSPGDDFLYLRTAVAFWGAGKQQEAVKAIRLASDLDAAKLVYYGLLEAMLRAQSLIQEANLERDKAAKMDRYDREALKRVLTEMGLQ